MYRGKEDTSMWYNNILFQFCRPDSPFCFLFQVNVEFPQYVVEALKHNEVISDEDLALVNQYQRESQVTIPSIRRRIKEIEAEIIRLQQLKKELQEDAKPAQKKLFACKVIKAPFRRVPFEIH